MSESQNSFVNDQKSTLSGCGTTFDKPRTTLSQCTPGKVTTNSLSSGTVGKDMRKSLSEYTTGTGLIISLSESKPTTEMQPCMPSQRVGRSTVVTIKQSESLNYSDTEQLTDLQAPQRNSFHAEIHHITSSQSSFSAHSDNNQNTKTTGVEDSTNVLPRVTHTGLSQVDQQMGHISSGMRGNDSIKSELNSADGGANGSMSSNSQEANLSKNSGYDEKISSERKPVITVDGLMFRNHLFEVVEELRIRRSLDIENEDRLKQIVREKHMLENNVEELRNKVVLLEQEKQEKVASTKATFHEQCRQMEEDKAKLTASLESADKEVKTLKDEVRTLQMSKYTLEKRVREQEKTLVSQRTAREGNLAQITELQELCKQLTQRANHLNLVQERLRRNVGEVSRINRQLNLANQKQSSKLLEQMDEVSGLHQQLKEAKVQLRCQPSDAANIEQEYKQQLEQLNKDMDEHARTIENLKSQLSDAREEHKVSVKSMQASQQLVNRHVSSLAVKQEQVEETEKRLTDLNNKYSNLQDQYDSTVQQWQLDKEAHDEIMWAWKNEAELCRPCCDKVCQVSTDHVDTETQVTVVIINQGSQTVTPNVKETETQTPSIGSCHQASQTETLVAPAATDLDLKISVNNDPQPTSTPSGPKAKRIKLGEVGEESTEVATPEKMSRYSFQFLNYPEKQPVVSSLASNVSGCEQSGVSTPKLTMEEPIGNVKLLETEAPQNTVVKQGILQGATSFSSAGGLFHPRRTEKKVTFAEQLENRHVLTEPVQQSSSNCSPPSGEESLFSDDEAEPELSNQVERIQQFLVNDRLKLPEK